MGKDDSKSKNYKLTSTDREQLCEDFLPLAYSIANRFVYQFPPQFRGEVYGEARFALWLACRKGNNRSTLHRYIRKTVKYELQKFLKYWRREKRQPPKRNLSLQKELQEDLTLQDIIPDYCNYEDYLIAKRIVHIMDEIDPLLRQRHIVGMQPEEIASELGVTKHAVNYRLQKARNKLKEKLREEGLR